jgi:hypothetical protein
MLFMAYIDLLYEKKEENLCCLFGQRIRVPVLCIVESETNFIKHEII